MNAAFPALQENEEVMDILARGIKADMLVLDLNMPKLDGFETARQIG